ncbi:hypothetical protein GCM10027614_78510 [Micromonospora vulcania]
MRRLITAAMKDDDLPIRSLCARGAVQAATDPAQLRGLLVSRTALVRAEALQAVTAVGDLGAAEAALPDRHPLVRAIAQAGCAAVARIRQSSIACLLGGSRWRRG